MKKVFGILVILFLLAEWDVFASDGRDTLVSRSGDKCIIPYEKSLSDGVLSVRFRSPIVFLGRENESRYKKRDELTLVFFDRNGNFLDAVFQGDVLPESFMVPSNARYESSREGYYLMHDSPFLSFQLKDARQGLELKIPVFLAHHVKRGKYRLISNCGILTLKVDPPFSKAVQKPGKTAETHTSTVEIEPDNQDVTRVLDCMANINSRLPLEDRLPFSESLEGDIRLLREWQYDVTDNALKKKITQTLDDYEAKKRQLEDAAVAREQAEQQRMQEEQRREQEEIQAQAEAAQKEEAEKSRKRNTWMIIGGVLLAIVAFAGNQLLQHLRTVKNQKSMMQMQQSMVRQAESAAKRKAGGVVRKTIGDPVRKAESKARTTISSKTGSVMKNKKKKKYSI